MIEVTIKFTHKTGEKKGTTGTLKRKLGTQGEDVPVTKLVALAYQTFLRRDIEVKSIEAKHWTPKILTVSLNDSGSVEILEEGKKQKKVYGLDGVVSDIQEMNATGLGEEVVAPPVESTQPSSPQVSAPLQTTQAAAPQVQPETQRVKSERQSVNVGETIYHPTDEERRRGIERVIVFTPQKRIRYEPVALVKGVPFQMNEILFAKERLDTTKRAAKDAEGNLSYYVVENDSGTFFIPDSSVNDVPEPSGGPDPFLVRGTGRGEQEVAAIVGQTKAGEAIYEEVPLQRTPDRQTLQTIGPGGAVPVPQINLRKGYNPLAARSGQPASSSASSSVPLQKGKSSR